MGLFGRKGKAPEIPAEYQDFNIEVDKSICTGEMTVGFRDPATGRLKLSELAESEADVEAFKKKYGRC